MNNSVAIDTNILIYLHDKSDTRKCDIAEEILSNNPKIPSQVVSEYINVTRRILNLSKSDILMKFAALTKYCEIIPFSNDTITNAVTLIDKYSFQIFDALIVASSLQAGCSILYSEDMQHELKINSMTIINPFKL